MGSAWTMSLGDQMRPRRPVTDPKAAERTRELIAETVWTSALKAAWPALAPVFAASWYLTGLARRDPARLDRLLCGEPGARLDALIAETEACADLDHPTAAARLR